MPRGVPGGVAAITEVLIITSILGVLIHYFEDSHRRRFDDIRTRLIAAENTITPHDWNILAQGGSGTGILDTRDRLRNERMPQVAGWYRPALYSILLSVTALLGAQAVAQTATATIPAWAETLVKGVFFLGLLVVGLLAGHDLVRVQEELRGYDDSVKRFASTAEGVHAVIGSRRPGDAHR